jgi:hypothetical protein
MNLDQLIPQVQKLVSDKIKNLFLPKDQRQPLKESILYCRDLNVYLLKKKLLLHFAFHIKKKYLATLLQNL